MRRAIFGPAWLVNTPKVEAMPLDERGYPLRMVAIDPRLFARHKAWLSRRPEREALEARRDIEQARAAGTIAVRYLRLPFDAKPLAAPPAEQRALAGKVTPPGRGDASEPNW